MAEFLYLFRGVEDMVSQASPTEMQQHMNKWRVWMEELATKGHLLGGQPLDVTGRVVYDSIWSGEFGRKSFRLPRM